MNDKPNRFVPTHGGDIYRNPAERDFSVNACPLPTPDAVLQAAQDAITRLDAYPDVEQSRFRAAAAQLEALEPSQIFGGSGATELLFALARSIAPKKALLAEPCFSVYRRALEVDERCEITTSLLRHKNDFALTDEILTRLTPDLDAFFLANPNNPTGRTVDDDLLYEILDRCEQNGTALIVDESFLRLSSRGVSLAREVTRRVGLYVVNSFTKLFAIPGARVGYVLSNDANIERLRRFLPEWNMSGAAQQIGEACANLLLQSDYEKDARETIERERAFLESELRDVGLIVYPSDANFLLFAAPFDFYEEALRRKTLIRSCANFNGLGPNYFRIAVKSHKENAEFALLMRQIVREAMPAAGAREVAGESRDAVERNSLRWREIERNESKRSETERAEAERAAEEDASTATERNKTTCVRPKPIEQSPFARSIEADSFALIDAELQRRKIVLPEDKAFLIKRVIHTTADFEYASTLKFSPNAIARLAELLRGGADIVTDTNMALSGINKAELAKYGGTVRCFTSDEDVAQEAKRRNVTRSAVAMERAAKHNKRVVFAIGNAPTALVRLRELYLSGEFRPEFIVGVPVGFVNVEKAKEGIVALDLPYIVNLGRKGGSPVAATVCNAVLYEMRKGTL